jgi:hypothetical protein
MKGGGFVDLKTTANARLARSTTNATNFRLANDDFDSFME